MGSFNVHDHVKIVADNEWTGLVGIVRDISNGFLHIVCVKRPTDMYLVDERNIDDIELFEY